MEFFEVLSKRRSIRKFKEDPFPDSLIEQALQAAVLAPNSSNTQTWDFYWVKDKAKQAKLVKACFNQSAARTATQLIVVVADPKLWRRSQAALIEWVKEARAPKVVLLYYEKLIPITYRSGFLNSLGFFKWFATSLYGFFKAVPRSPYFRRDLQEVAIKSAALAAENMVLAITALGGASCMMEGFDECRVKKLLGLRSSARVVMVLGIGYESERGTWGPRFRLPLDAVVHRV